MLADTQIFMLWIALTVVSYWLLPENAGRSRSILLSCASAALIFVFAPFAVLYVLYIIVACAVSTRCLNRWRNRWLLTIALLAAAAPLLFQRTVWADASIIHTLGITFATLRGVALVLDSYVNRSVLPVHQQSVALLFLPLYTVGPVEAASRFADDRFHGTPPVAFMLRGLSRICLGLFKTVFIADGIIRTFLDTHYPIEGRDFNMLSSADLMVFVLASFAYTYINFSGFVDIANGVSRLFGLKIIENFNFPIFAGNLQDFWRRWHISLGNWINRYLYFPLVAWIRTSWAPYAAIFTAFTAIGWWHDSSWTYLSWGALHGSGLCLVLLWQRTLKKHYPSRYKRLLGSRLYALASWMLTVFYAAWVQTFANQSSFADAVAMSKNLFGG